MSKLISSVLVMAFSVSAMASEKSTPQLVERGKKLFKMNCAVCHGEAGKGDGAGAAALKPPPRDLTKGEYKAGGSPKELFATLTKGLAGTAMAPFGHLPEGDRWALVHFVSSLNKSKK
jgi:mono/diheme cytochrome c family protein